jgi:hypothetical protein
MQNRAMIELLRQLRESVADTNRQQIDALLAEVRSLPIDPASKILQKLTTLRLQRMSRTPRLRYD